MPTHTKSQAERVHMSLKGFSWMAPSYLSPVAKLLTSNQNFAPVAKSAPRRRLTIAESLARNKLRYHKTLERLE